MAALIFNKRAFSQHFLRNNGPGGRQSLKNAVFVQLRAVAAGIILHYIKRFQKKQSPF